MCGHFFTLIAVVLLVPIGVQAQTASVTMKGTVSETVTLSIAPTSTRSNLEVVSRGRNSVEIILSGDEDHSEVVRVPLLVRSNSGFKISAVFESKTAGLSQLLVADVRATGRLVSPQIVSALQDKPQLNPDTGQPLLVVSGPRVSLGGTLDSPNNALQITVLIRLKPQPARAWSAQLTFVATPVSLIQ
ncbi:MAG TPA: hypothetical protein VKB02_01815 [Pyrinomonadaceae bacterium]|nr:hypothetical protein [Pyrinomonadaceae bacterium]